MVLGGTSKPCKKPYKEAKTEIMRPRQTTEVQESRMQEQESRIRALERRLAYYDSPNTPPSRSAPGGIGMPPATVHSIMRRTGACLRKPAGGILEAIRGAAAIHAD